MSCYNRCQDCLYGTSHYDKNIRLTDYACTERLGITFAHDTSECKEFKKKSGDKLEVN